MPRRRRAAAALALLGAVVTLAGCSGEDTGDGDAPAAAATPTAVGDRPRVEVLDAGAGDRRVLAFDLAPDDGAAATIRVAQQVTRDEETTVVPPVAIAFTSRVTAADGDDGDDAVTTTRTYARPRVEATGSDAQAVAGVERALSPLTGSTSTLVVRPDGTTVEAASGVPAAESVDAQVRGLVAVLPSEAVGVGARWTATSVDRVDRAVVDQVATYTLTALDRDTYDIEVSVEQTYRPGPVGEVEVSSGLGTVDARLTGSLDRLLPDTASGDVATQVSYVVGGRLTEVRTTARLGLEAGPSDAAD